MRSMTRVRPRRVRSAELIGRGSAIRRTWSLCPRRQSEAVDVGSISLSNYQFISLSVYQFLVASHGL